MPGCKIIKLFGKNKKGLGEKAQNLFNEMSNLASSVGVMDLRSGEHDHLKLDEISHFILLDAWAQHGDPKMARKVFEQHHNGKY